MAVTEKGKIDGIGISKEDGKLILMISDHLSWNNEDKHLIVLQEKIKSYAVFIQGGQVKKMYPQCDEYLIKIFFKHEPTEKCNELLRVMSEALEEMKIQVEYEM